MTQADKLPDAATAMHWRVHNLDIAGMCWGPVGGRPVLALHGWLDNAASFSLLAPRLAGCRVTALDLSGHGETSHRSADAGYQIWDDLPEIIAIADQMGWESFDLIGHSRGAIIAAMLASAFPERVKRLVLLDAVSPPALPEADFPAQIRQAILDKQRLLDRANRQFDDASEAVSAREKSGLERVAAQLITERNLEPQGAGVSWTTDPRLTGASMVKLSAGQVEAVLDALSMPVLLLLASDAARRHPQIEAQARSHINQLQVIEIEGGHHFHMENNVDVVAGHISTFLQGGKAS